MKTKLFYLIVILIGSGFTHVAFSQNTVMESYTLNGIIPPVFHPDTGISCSGGPGSEIHDDGSYENAYGVPDDSCRYVIKMRPAVYPWNYLSLCITFTRLVTGTPNLTFDIVVYDTLGAGGSPGNLKAIFTNKSAPGINIFPAFSSFRYTFLNIPTLFTGAYYIGIRYHNNPSTGVYLAQDESPGTLLWPGYQGTGNTPAWITTQSGAGNQSYRCSAIRSEGSFGIVQLCEQFVSAGFPPAGWNEVFSGTNYWSRVTQSAFGLGTGSAKYDCWNAPNGTLQAMVSPSFSSSPVDSLVFDVAYQPYTTAPDSLLIMTSNDYGVSYSYFRRLGPVELTTTSSNPTPFVPTAGQWVKKVYGPLPSGTNRIAFVGKSGFGDNIYLDSICTTSFLVGTGHNQNTLPLSYSLAQNYPNPFNPATTISFAIPKAGNVKLIVYDLLGREVKLLVNDFRNPGKYSISFDASELASGIYFYEIKSGEFTDTKKMLLVK